MKDKSIAIMQPYFFPYISYFQLINAVDTFVIYDNIQYTKKGWINRNRLIFNNKIEYFTINLVKDSDYLDVVERKISPLFFEKESKKILNKIKQNYRKAPFFNEIYPILIKIFFLKTDNLFDYIFESLKIISDYFEIKTILIKSSSLNINHELKGVNKVLGICNILNANNYINPIGGIELYNKKEFLKEGVTLNFLKSYQIKYHQFNIDFVPNLSIIDVMMFNSKEEIKEMLNKFQLV